LATPPELNPRRILGEVPSRRRRPYTPPIILVMSCCPHPAIRKACLAFSELPVDLEATAVA